MKFTKAERAAGRVGIRHGHTLPLGVAAGLCSSHTSSEGGSSRSRRVNDGLIIISMCGNDVRNLQPA